MTLEGMAGLARIGAEASHCAKIGHFYFATTRRAAPYVTPHFLPGIMEREVGVSEFSRWS
jgi:hypothetical protein